MHDSRSRSRLFAPGGTRCSWPPQVARPGVAAALALALPIIVMSGGDGAGRVDVLGDTLLLGAMATIPKPFLLHQVLDAVARVLATDQASETA
jgi:hypothetical protein